MTTPHKVYIAGLVAMLAIAVVAGVAWFRAHEAWKDKERQVAVEETLQGAFKQQIKQIQADHQQAIDQLEAITSKPATIQSVTKLLPVQLPGQIQIQQVDGKPTLTVSGDPQKNLDKIQEAEASCAKCTIDLTEAIAELTVAKKLIPSLTRERDDLKSLAIPRWTATLGVTKGQIGSYKPAAFLDYRVTKQWGLTVGAANNSLFGGVSIHFGSTEKKPNLNQIQETK